MSCSNAFGHLKGNYHCWANIKSVQKLTAGDDVPKTEKIPDISKALKKVR